MLAGLGGRVKRKKDNLKGQKIKINVTDPHWFEGQCSVVITSVFTCMRSEGWGGHVPSYVIFTIGRLAADMGPQLLDQGPVSRLQCS